MLLTCLDQSDIQHVQTSLFALSGLLGQIVDGAPLATLVIDAAHRVTHWNAACERLTGLARREVVGRREAWRAMFTAPRPMLADLIVDGIDVASRAVPGGLALEAWFPQFGPEGAWLYATAAPLRDAEGRVVGAIETLQDVSRRRRTEQELQRHRDELEDLVRRRSAELAATADELAQFIEEAPIGVAWSCEGVLQRANPALVAMLGERPGGWVGAPLAELGRRGLAAPGRRRRDLGPGRRPRGRRSPGRRALVDDAGPQRDPRRPRGAAFARRRAARDQPPPRGGAEPAAAAGQDGDDRPARGRRRARDQQPDRLRRRQPQHAAPLCRRAAAPHRG
ncbi:PAS domain-containing protein [Piscinibacter sakaiensis]|uniref:PAS domain-containing protein n=1 Tax=Piscinibacter sakaiensis TaxID=1547922 RepID=UPI0037294B67